VGYSQSTKKLEKKADNSFKNKNYYNAAIIYSAILYNSPIGESNLPVVYPIQVYSKTSSHNINEANKNRVIFKLAESYRLYNHFKEAASQYLLYINTKDLQYPEAELWYGYCLLANDDPQKALQTFNSFLKKHKGNNPNTIKAQQGIESCKLILANKSEKPFATVTKLQATGSEDGSNFALDKFNDSIFWFTSSRHEIDKRQNKTYPLRLYTGGEKLPNVSKVFDEVASNINMAASSLSTDGNTVFFTGWKDDPKLGVPSFAIYYMIRAIGSSKWSSPIILPSPVNLKGYQSKQPFITKDGKYLLFVSDQPGGVGKFDIWAIAMDGVKPIGSAINFDAKINTQGNDVTPYYNISDSVLYFSSDGRLGMGGMDIYETKGSLVDNKWSDSVKNLGIPYNSVKDDQYFKTIGNSDTGYLSSDRLSSCCLEIFRTIKIKKIDTLIVKNNFNDLSIRSNKTQEESPVKLFEEKESNEKHLIDSINAITFLRRNVYYNFASSKVRKEDFSQLDDIVEALNKNADLNILIASFTDCKGSQEANIRLSRKRSESVRWYLIAKGISTSRINIDFFGKEHFILQCKEDTTYNSSNQLLNRRSDLIITKSQKPIWIPSGRELDITKIIIDSNYHSPEFYAITRRININNETQSPLIKHINESKLKSAYVRPKEPNYQIREKKENSLERLPGITFNYSQKKYMVPIPNKLPMNEMLDMTPRLKESKVIDEMTKRVPRKPIVVYSTSDSVKIDLYDNGIFDYDTVSVIFDKHISVYKELLQVDKPISFYVKLNSEQSRNEMIFFAENLGLTPPNSALMVITDAQNKRTEVSVSSDLDHNVVIYFIKLDKGQRN
jgi:outer membrane protein OmpA-like peptidoglycan-associated protein